MKEIKFDSSLIQPTIDGVKTQTRRIVKENEGEPCRYGNVGDRLLISGTSIVIEIVSLWGERLNEISESDALDEGAPLDKLPDGGGEGGEFFCPTHWFQYLWESINGKDSWSANPWVWVIEFKVVSQ